MNCPMQYETQVITFRVRPDSSSGDYVFSTSGPVLGTTGPHHQNTDGGAPILHGKMYGCLYFM